MESEPLISRKRRVLKPVKGGMSEIVHLVIYGPKWLLPVIPLTSEASIKDTWLEVLNRQLNIRMSPADATSLMVRTRHYKTGVYGHSADLDTKIADFAKGFLYRKKTYFVLICGNQKRLSYGQTPPTIPFRSFGNPPVSSVGSSSQLPTVLTMPPGNSAMTSTSNYISRGNPVQQQHPSVFKATVIDGSAHGNAGEDDIQVIEPDQNEEDCRTGVATKQTSNGSDWMFERPLAPVTKRRKSRQFDWTDSRLDDFDVEESLMDNSTVFGGEEGPEVIEDLKSLVEGRVKNISNAFLLQARKQYRDLKKKSKWEKVVARFPLGGYILSELFK